MNYIQSEAVLESSMIQTLLDLGYEQVSIPDEQPLLINFGNQISLHNLQKNLKNTPFTDSEFERLMISLGGKSVFNSAYNLRQLQTITINHIGKKHQMMISHIENKQSKL